MDGSGGSSGVSDVTCPACKHDHPVNTGCATCGHHRKPPAPPAPHYREGGSSGRPANSFVTRAYDLVRRPDALPGDDNALQGLWNFERTMRMRMREELCPAKPPTSVQIAEAAAKGTPLAALVHMCPLPAGWPDQTQEYDAHDDRATTRHLVGRIGDAPVATLRWRLTTLGSDVVALVDRIYVIKLFRRRRVARTTMLNALVDMLDVDIKPGWGGLAAIPSVQFVSVVLPQEERLKSFFDLLVGMGFAPRRTFPSDPTGQWEEPPGAPARDPPLPPAPARNFVEVSLAFGAVLPLLQRAHAEREGMRPRSEGT